MLLRSIFGRSLALGLVLLIGTSANAVPRGTPKKAHKAGQHAAGSSSLISQLRQAKSILEHADHDYQGHRAAAVHSVSAAISALEGHKHKKTHRKATTTTVKASKPAKTGVKKGRGKGRKISEVQSSSDTQLRQALAKIQQVMASLKQGNNQKTSAAHAHLAKASNELKVALKVK